MLYKLVIDILWNSFRYIILILIIQSGCNLHSCHGMCKIVISFHIFQEMPQISKKSTNPVGKPLPLRSHLVESVHSSRPHRNQHCRPYSWRSEVGGSSPHPGSSPIGLRKTRKFGVMKQGMSLWWPLVGLIYWNPILTQCGLMTAYGDRDLGQYWLW